MIVLITVVAISRILSRPHVDLMSENQGSAFYNLLGVQSTVHQNCIPITNCPNILEAANTMPILCLYYANTLPDESITPYHIYGHRYLDGVYRLENFDGVLALCLLQAVS